MFLALAIRLLALLLTPLLLRFFSEPGASLLPRPGGLPLPLLFSPPTTAGSVDFIEVPLAVAVSALRFGEDDLLLDWFVVSAVLGSDLVFAELELPPPNILFSRLPPWAERLRRLFPASF